MALSLGGIFLVIFVSLLRSERETLLCCSFLARNIYPLVSHIYDGARVSQLQLGFSSLLFGAWFCSQRISHGIFGWCWSERNVFAERR